LKTFFLVAGANGSGKTTLIKELLYNLPDFYFLNSDEIAYEIGDDIGIRAGKIMLQKFEDYVAEEKSIIMESTISGRFHNKILEKVSKEGYKSTLYYVFLDLVDLNIRRVENRVLLGGHNVPIDDIYRRYDRSLKNFWSVMKVVDNWELRYSFQNGFDLIAFGNDKNEVINPLIYKKFKEISHADS